MKRAADLIGAIAEPENIRHAFVKAARGKQGRREVQLFRENLQDNLSAMCSDIRCGEVQVGEYRFFTVYEPKKRDICAASFNERVLHHAVMNVVEPVFERYAIYDSYACRKKKGMHAAVQKAQHFSRRYQWCLKLDIEKYFDSMDHCVILELLQRLIKDKAVVGLFAQIIDSYQVREGRGMPIGNLISQHIANLYLGVFDHWVKEILRVEGYVRYMDDFLIFSNDRSQLKSRLQEVEKFLINRLKLKLHKNRQLAKSCHGIPYLGYRVFPDGYRLQAKSRNRFARKFKQYEDQYLRGVWDIETLNCHMNAMIGFTAGAESVGFRRKIIRTSRVLTEENMARTV